RLVAELGLELLSRAAGAVAARIAGLRHEARDDAGEGDAVVKAFARQLLYAGDMVWREIGPELGRHASGRHIEIEGLFEASLAHLRGPFRKLPALSHSGAQPASRSARCSCESVSFTEYPVAIGITALSGSNSTRRHAGMLFA